MIWPGYAVQVLAYTLFALFLSPYVAKHTQQFLTAIMAAGIGLAISPTMLVIQASVPHEDMAAATSGWVMVRSIGPSIGFALFNALLDTQVRYRFSRIEGYGIDFDTPHGKADYDKLHRLAEPVKGKVLMAFAASFRVRICRQRREGSADEQTCWTVGAGLMAFALLLTLTTFTRQLGKEHEPASEDEEQVLSPGLGAGPTYGSVGQAVRP